MECEDEDFLDESKPSCSFDPNMDINLKPECSAQSSHSITNPGNYGPAVNHVTCNKNQTLEILKAKSQDHVSLNFRRTEWGFVEELSASNYNLSVKNPTSTINRLDPFQQLKPVSWESLGVPYATGRIRPVPVVSIYFTEDRNFLVFDEMDIIILKEEYRIISPQLSLATKLSSPGLLLPEQAQVLVENGFAQVKCLIGLLSGVCKREIDNSQLTRQTILKRKLEKSENATSIKRSKKDGKIRTDGELREFAIKSIVGRTIKEEKRQKFGTDASPDLLRVTDCDRKRFKGEVPEEEIVATINEMRRKLDEKDANIRERENLPSMYEVMENPPFPTDPNYQKRLTVFRDLWRKGFYLTGGTKFGCDYLAYEGSPGNVHSRYMVVCLDADSDILRPLDMISVGRAATQVKKRLLLSIASQGSLIPYYIEAGWWKGGQ
ncbi:tRNA-splicing endonuclease subunit Sen34 [Ditylenchus destructor]|uniref:tRNA-intron lyase n=1 Tax=Ditylenchus destructor TaxID=166010 RepID=A0AAD4MVI1_9BILA|nr:tRNA-splicing endonuclease subunit Sen34 [Ditylenchus destructor]